MKFTSIPDVIAAMEKLDSELPATNLANVRAFNHTYLIITRAVFAKFGKKVFQNEDVMQKVDVKFFDFYNSPLQKYQQGKPVPPAWQTLFDFSRQNSSFQFVYMALGVNAHVNNDLPQTLLAADVPDSFKADYDRVNELIAQSLGEVITSLPEDSKTVKALENSLRPLYAFLLNSLIKQWRETAWQNFVKLKAGEIRVSEVEERAQKIARKLAEIDSLQDIRRLRDVFWMSF